MQKDTPTSMPDKLSPRPSPQHSKSLTAPLDCTNCSKQHSNPINNFMSKWKYKEDLAKPQNAKRTRPRKQPQTTYHFPLSHCSVSTFNPNNKQSEGNDTSSPTHDSSTESPETTPRSDNSPRSDTSSRSDTSPCTSPRQVSREILLNHHRAQLFHQQSERFKRRYHEEDDAEEDEEGEVTNDYQPSPRDHQLDMQFDTHMQRHEQSGIYHAPSPNHTPPAPASASYNKKRLYSSSAASTTPDYRSASSSIEISTICNPTSDSPRSPQSSDDSNDSSNDQAPYEGNSTLRSSKKRRSSLTSVFETIEISDSDSDSFATLPFDPVSGSFHRVARASVPPLSNCLPSSRVEHHAPLPSPPQQGGYRHPLSLTSAHNDLAKYHLAAPSRKSPTVPPLAFARLPSIDELPFFPWPRDDSNPRFYENIRMHPRSQSFPTHPVRTSPMSPCLV